MEINNNVQILSLEGKDLIDNKKVITNKSLRIGSLDDSLEVDKLRTLNNKIIQFDEKKQRFYTDDIISVTFKYAIKDSEELDLKIKAVNNYCNSLMEITKRQYESGFKEYKNKKDCELELKNIIKKSKQLIKELKDEYLYDRNSIRDYLYENGFELIFKESSTSKRYTKRRYTRYKRTSGSARVGKCLFINEKYFKEMNDWSFAGIPHGNGSEMDCASLEAYISLPTSSAIDRFQLKPENILLIDDYTSTFQDTVMATELVNEEEDSDGNIASGDLFTDVKKAQINNSIFDGESLLDKSVFIEKGYEDKASLQIRNIFFKGIGVNTDIQKFFKDNNITNIGQLNGKTIATNINQIKLITTPSSVKYMKFGKFEDWLKRIEENWAICKYEKPQSHFNGMVQTHYQLLNGIGMTKKEMEEFLQDTISYIKLLRTNRSVFKYHLGLKQNGVNNREYSKIRKVDNDNDFAVDMMSVNDDFLLTKMGKKYRNNIIDSYISNVRKGHVLVEGNYSTLVSCPYEYLLHSIGKFNGESVLKPHECVNYKFNKDEEILAVRSPQPTMSNIVVLKNTRCEFIEKYFKTNSKEILYFSPIGWNILELLSSADMDGDQALITNNSILVNSAKRLQRNVVINGKKMSRFLISTDFTPKSKIKRKYTPLDLSDVDVKCSQNKIGEIINLAQILNSLYWEKEIKGASEEELLSLYKDISNLNVLSCIEIDRCKKISPVDSTKELNKIRSKYNLGKGEIVVKNGQELETIKVNVRPMFFKYLDGGKNYSFKYFNTGMDYLNDILNKKLESIKQKREKDLMLHELFYIKEDIDNKINFKTISKMANISIKLKNKCKYIFNNKNLYDNVYEATLEAKAEAVKKIKNIGINDVIIYEIVKRISLSYTDKKYKSFRAIGKYIFDILYDNDKYGFMKNVKVKNKNNYELIEDKEGKILIYGLNFTEKVDSN